MWSSVTRKDAAAAHACNYSNIKLKLYYRITWKPQIQKTIELHWELQVETIFFI